MAHVSYINGHFSGEHRTSEPCGRPLCWNGVCIRVSHVQQADVSVEPRALRQGHTFHVHARSVFSSDGPDWTRNWNRFELIVVDVRLSISFDASSATEDQLRQEGNNE